MDERYDCKLPLEDEEAYKVFMRTLLDLAIKDNNNPALAEQFFELQRRASRYNRFERQIDYVKEEPLFNAAISASKEGTKETALPFEDESEYRAFMRTLLDLAARDDYNPALAEQFFELQRRASRYNGFEREIDYGQEEILFNEAIKRSRVTDSHTKISGFTHEDDDGEIDF